jgi:CRISPR/Cas system CSM-associated protein Csm4 (group 5 of RAMP superfamily)
MYKARKNVEMKSTHRDIIEEYAHYGSTVYAPITRDGLSLDKKANKYEVQPEALSSYAGLKDLEQVLLKKPGQKDFVTDFNVTKIKTNLKKTSRKDKDHMEALEKAQKTIEAYVENAKKEDQQLEKEKDDEQNFWVRKETPDFLKMSKDPTQRKIERKSLQDMEREDVRLKAIYLLQRLMRGRA